MLRDQHKSNTDHQSKLRQLENELDEQRRETVRRTSGKKPNCKFSSCLSRLECLENGIGIT